MFLAEAPTAAYRAVLNAEKSGAASLRISAVGDDAQPVPVKAVKAWTDDGNKLEVDEKGIIKHLSLDAGRVKKIYIQVDSADRLSLEVSAHED